MLTTSQRVAVDNAINSMTGCKEMQALARQLLNDGSIRYYLVDDGNWGDSHWPENPQVHLWEDLFQTSGVPDILAHEVAHIYYETTDEFVPNLMETNCY